MGTLCFSFHSAITGCTHIASPLPPREQKALGKWIKSYEADRVAAMVALLNTFIRCCGCHEKINVSRMSHIQDACRALTENVNEVCFARVSSGEAAPP